MKHLCSLQFENELISKLDQEVEGGRGDEQYKILLEKTWGFFLSYNVATRVLSIIVLHRTKKRKLIILKMISRSLSAVWKLNRHTHDAVNDVADLVKNEKGQAVYAYWNAWLWT